MSFEKLRQEKPYLSRTIRMVAAHDRPVQQLEMGKAILEDFSTSLLFKAEKSLDLLQAMLVYNAWQYYHFSVSSRTTTVLQLTLGLMFELGINTPQSHEKEEPFSHEMKSTDDMMTKPETNTTDEQRAFLGCFFFASVVSLCFKKSDGLRYSPYIEICCDALSSSLEQRSDAFLVASVRLQCIIERMQVVLSFRSVGLDASKAPIGMHVNMFQTELQAFKASLPLDIQQSLYFALHYHNAEIHLYEHGIPNASSTMYGTHSSNRVDMLYACLVACQSFFDIFLALPSDVFFSLSISTFAHMTLALATVFKLSLLDAPGWDLAHVRQRFDVALLPDKLIARFQEASRTIDPRQQINGTDAFSRCAQRFRQIKRWYDTKTTADSAPASVDVDAMEAFERDFLQENYWQDLIRGW
ncbi:hypothetical protein MMC07_005237 [Pseudocyphellaria aurata]|nr:hypothetical protein [Pseudocyphellaria aurata]